jgi:hypothetical protein
MNIDCTMRTAKQADGDLTQKKTLRLILVIKTDRKAM